MFYNVDKKTKAQPKQKEVNGKIINGIKGRPRRANMIHYHGKLDSSLKARMQRYLETCIDHTNMSSLINVSVKEYLDNKGFV